MSTFLKFIKRNVWFVLGISLMVFSISKSEVDAGSSVHSLTVDGNGKVSVHQRDGESQTVLSDGNTGTQEIAGSISFPNGGGSALSHYEEYSYTTTFTAGGTGGDRTTNGSLTITLVRVGSMVSMRVFGGTGGAATIDDIGTGTGNIDVDTNIPANFRPVSGDNVRYFTEGVNNGTAAQLRCDVQADGNISCFPQIGGSFVNNTAVSIGKNSVSTTVNWNTN